MPSFRDHLETLEEDGKLERVETPVDPSWELPSMARWLYHGFDDADRFALRFEDVEGSEYPVVAAALGTSRSVYADSLGVDPDGIREFWWSALDDFRAPRSVTDAPVQERVSVGSDVALDDLPVPTWTPGKDAGPYLTAVIVTKNRDTGVQNMAVYRCQVVDEDTIALNMSPRRHGHRDYQSFAEVGESAPVAIAIGAAPAVYYSSITNVGYEVDERELAGGLLGAPLETVDAETIDLEVPADAEFVIEGEVDPDERYMEGPFGEFAGYMGHVQEKPVIDVTAITSREDPIYYGLMGQIPPSEDHVIQSISNAALHHKQLVEAEGFESVSDVAIDRTYSGITGQAFVTLDPRYDKEGKDVGLALAEMTHFKRIMVVNEDVDIRDPLHVAWAMNARVDASRDTMVLEDVYINSAKDPAVETETRRRSDSTKLVIDATVESLPEDPPAMSIPPKDDMEAALDSWAAADLPAIEPKRRMELLLEHNPGPRRDRTPTVQGGE